MSNFGENENIINIEEAAMKAKEETKSFWEKHKEGIILGISIGLNLLLNRKINALENKTANTFKKTASILDEHANFINENFDTIYNNFRYCRADITNVATFVGFQGKLGVNTLPGDN